MKSTARSEEHTSELQSRGHLVCRLLLDPLPTAFYTLSLHDALPILPVLGDDAAWAKGTRFYVEMGSAGGANYPGETPLDDVHQLVQVLESAGLKRGGDFQYDEVNGEIGRAHV